MTSLPFFGRRAELAALERELQQVVRTRSGRLVAVRGRRQVGKSRLVERFAAASGVHYGIVAGMKGAPVGVQMLRAVETLRASRRPLPALAGLEVAPPVNWFDLVNRVRLGIADAPAVLVIDEFPWAEETDRGLDGLLQSLWDGDLRRAPLLMLLVGSDAALMDRLFEHDRPLFGRLRSSVVVAPFDPVETRLALGGARHAVDTFDFHLVTGGFPELVDHARGFDGVGEFVADALSRPHSVLADVAAINLAGEFADAGASRVVLEAIGGDDIGVVAFSRVVSMLGGGKAAETAVSRAMHVLAEGKRIVEIDHPLGNPKSRLRRYRVADSYLRFWFRFMEPQMRNVEVGRANIAIRAFRAGWSAWRGKAIEPVVRSALLRLAPHLGKPYDAIESVGGWWDRTGGHEIDLVASDGGGMALVTGSIKWRERSRFSARDLHDLAAARSAVPRLAGTRLVALSANGASAGVEADLVLDAESLIEAWRG